jgi:streptomycin 6-kinase
LAIESAVVRAPADWAAWFEAIDSRHLPEWLGWVAKRNHGRQWLDRVPAAIRSCVAAWELKLGRPLIGGSTAFVVEARRADGTDAVLKIQYLDRECEFEADALRAWGGKAAARLLEFDPTHHALLLERCRPGVGIYEWDVPVRVHVETLAELAGRTIVPAGAPFGTLEFEAEFWINRIEDLRREMLWEPRLSDAAVDALRSVGPTQSEQLLLNLDLNAGNVVSSTRSPWLVIDPKPVVGERAFMASPVVRSHRLGPSRRCTIYRLDAMSSSLGVDRERARLWSIGHALAWARWCSHPELQLDVVRWLIDA